MKNKGEKNFIKLSLSADNMESHSVERQQQDALILNRDSW